MGKGNAKYAGLIALAYAIVFFGGIFLHYFLSGSLYTLKYSLSLPKVWLVLATSLAIGWGLINSYCWAWWLGLVGVLFQLYGASQNAWQLSSNQSGLPAGIIIILVLLYSFLFLLLTPAVRKECLKNAST